MPSSLRNLANDFEDLDIQDLLANLDDFNQDELAEINVLVDELATRNHNEKAYNDLIEFCKRMQPDYIVGKHHQILADMLMDIAEGKKDRICVNIPPRHGKSQLVSIFFPAWFLGRNPNKKVMMVSHTTDLAVDFGRKVRNLISTDDYKAIFPTVALAVDSKSAGRWNTNTGGEYYACGIGSSIAGRGADLLLIDDPHSEQDVINGNFEVFDKAYEWFTYGARTRLMPGGRVAIIQTRWHMDDLTGRVVTDMAQNDLADQYDIVEFPAVLEVANKKGSGYTEKPLWPEFWWQKWGDKEAPMCEYIIMSLDAAAESHNRADYTALTTWGVFLNEETGIHNVILLNSIKKRMEFPELKALAFEEYETWDPDSFIVEKKSSGTALYQEMRRMGLPVQEYTPHRGSGDKLARLNSVADIVASELVWIPATRWAEEVVEEIAGFPFMSHDDLVDSTVMALMRFRQGGFIRLPSDEPEEIQYFKSRQGGYY